MKQVKNIKNFDEKYRNVKVISVKMLKNVKNLTLIWLHVILRILIENTKTL